MNGRLSGKLMTTGETVDLSIIVADDVTVGDQIYELRELRRVVSVERVSSGVARIAVVHGGAVRTILLEPGVQVAGIRSPVRFAR